MARLSLSLLGSLQVILSGAILSGYTSGKVWALLAYLMVESGQPHRREALAALLWPECSDQAALTHLRYALSDLRKAIGDRDVSPPFLLITRDSVAWNHESDHWLDVEAFIQLVAQEHTGRSPLDRLQQAVALYRGEFLQGFSVDDSEAFEEWALLKREHFRQSLLSALRRLAALYEQRSEYDQARFYVRRQLDLEPWQEEAHQQLMRLLAASGQRSAALAQYASCRRVLAAELGVEPTGETRSLYESIRDGRLSTASAPPAPFSPHARILLFAQDRQQQAKPGSPFFARAQELTWLEGHLDAALAGQGRVVLVTGDAGSGKTTLVSEFSHQAMSSHPDLIVAAGTCSAHRGLGDLYQPFREITQLLAGDVEAKRAGGAITTEHTRRLWALLPYAAEAFLEQGPDLLARMVSVSGLRDRLHAYASAGGAVPADWLARLEPNPEPSGALREGARPVEPVDLYEQVTRVLRALADHRPLLLVLDDLQWADKSSVSLLFHLGQRLEQSRILLVGAFRPADLALGREGERHPLEPVVNELQRQQGEMVLDLNQADGREFIGALLDAEPNLLDADFRDTFHRHTAGNPLFAVELLKGLEDRGDLVRDGQGRWTRGPALDWEKLPARVEAVIAERIGRLAPEDLALLSAASVEGAEFTAEVAARIVGMQVSDTVRMLSGSLARQQRLVYATSLERLGRQGAYLSRYRFRHDLFQRYLYQRLDRVERAQLHEAVAEALEALYRDAGVGTERIAGTLAWHWERAGWKERAIEYWLRDGQRAVQFSAYGEGAIRLRRGLELLSTLPPSRERDQQEFRLQMALAVPLLTISGWSSAERAAVLARAYALGQRIGETAQFVQALWLLANLGRGRGEQRKSLELAEQLYQLVQPSQDPTQLVLAHCSLGESYFLLGELGQAQAHLIQALRYHTPELGTELLSFVGLDVSVVCVAWLGLVQWGLGYPDQALAQSRKALALAEVLGHPFTLYLALNVAGITFHLARHEYRQAQQFAERARQLAAQEHFDFFRAWDLTAQGYQAMECGAPDEAIACLEEGVALWQRKGTQTGLPLQLAVSAQAFLQAGRFAQGCDLVDEAVRCIERTETRYYEAEILRLKGELLLAAGAGEAQAEACFHRAREVAKPHAMMFELRAAVSLARLWQRQGRPESARQLLAEVYGRFTEGFETPDLCEARALLDALAASR